MSSHADTIRAHLDRIYEVHEDSNRAAFAALGELLAEKQRLHDALNDLDALTFEDENDEKCVREIIASALDGTPSAAQTLEDTP